MKELRDTKLLLDYVKTKELRDTKLLLDYVKTIFFGTLHLSRIKITT